MATPVPTRRILATRTAHSGRRKESRRTGCRFASRSRPLGFRPSQTLCVKREMEFVLPRGLGRETGRRFDRRLLPGPDASLGGGRRRALHRRDPHSLQANSRTQPSAIPVGTIPVGTIPVGTSARFVGANARDRWRCELCSAGCCWSRSGSWERRPKGRLRRSAGATPRVTGRRKAVRGSPVGRGTLVMRTFRPRTRAGRGETPMNASASRDPTASARAAPGCPGIPAGYNPGIHETPVPGRGGGAPSGVMARKESRRGRSSGALPQPAHPQCRRTGRPGRESRTRCPRTRSTGVVEDVARGPPRTTATSGLA